jgi:co-chaperonin GroES (HSP10)
VTEQKQLSFKLEPAPGRVIVQEDDFRYEGKIIIPEKAQRRPTVGRVIAIASDVGEVIDDPDTGLRTFLPRWLVGDKLVYGLYSGTVINFKGQPAFRILGQDEVLARVTGNPELEGVGS